MIDVEKGGGDIFLKGTRGENENENHSTANKMLVERKLEAIEYLLTQIQEEVPSANIKEIKVNDNGTFDGYVIIPIDGTNVTLFENMNDKENSAIYIVDNAQIQNIVYKLTKKDAKNLQGVDSVNHTDDTPQDNTRFEGYKERLCSKAKAILNYPQKTMQRNRVKRNSKEWLDRFERAKEKTQN